MKRFLIAGNWKMNTNIFESKLLVDSILNNLPDGHPNVEVLVCPPFTSLSALSDMTKGTKILLGAQNCHWAESGAFTGEISINMLSYIGCSHIIIGHSERRTYFFESNDVINKKVNAVIKSGMSCICCIGETLEERQSGKTFDILSNQINVGLEGLDSDELSRLVIAYEPVWAIGTGLAANNEQISEAHTRIREMLLSKFGQKAEKILIQYGGSVTDANAGDILSINDVNGALIGGASLKSASFLFIINKAIELS